MRARCIFLSLLCPSLAVASAPIPKLCKVKAEILSIESLSEVTGNGASVELKVKLKESSCDELGVRNVQFYWDPKARFRHRLDQLRQTNKQISKLGVFRSGSVVEALMEEPGSIFKEMNGLKLPAP